MDNGFYWLRNKQTNDETIGEIVEESGREVVYIVGVEWELPIKDWEVISYELSKHKNERRDKHV